jgi:hypothetical protein
MTGKTNGVSTCASRLVWPLVLVFALALPGLAGCGSGGVAAENESQAPADQVTSLQQELTATKQQLADVQQQLAEAVAQRDALASAAPQSSERHDKATATQEAVTAIVNDPESVGTEQEVVDALTAYYTPDAMMVDAVFGSIGVRSGWYNTLYGGAMDTTFDGTYWWVSEDGSQGGSVWLWHGTNAAGNPFELAGISLDDFNEEGLISNEYVVYPYPADYVKAAIEGAGT